MKPIKKVCRSLVRPPSPKTILSNVSSSYFSLYPTTKKTPLSMDELRYLLFCQKRQKTEAPSTHIGQLHPAFKESQLSHTSLEEITCWESRSSRTSVLWLEGGRWKVEDGALTKGYCSKRHLLESLYGGQFTLSTPLIKQNFCILLPHRHSTTVS